MVTPIKVRFISIHSLSVIYENHEECPLTKLEQFSKCCFGEISSQLLITPPYIIYKIST